jgi:hypothetical protein
MRASGLKEQTASETGDFFVSLAVAAATDDWALGTLVGGDLAGGLLGDIMAGDAADAKDQSEPQVDGDSTSDDDA